MNVQLVQISEKEKHSESIKSLSSFMYPSNLDTPNNIRFQDSGENSRLSYFRLYEAILQHKSIAYRGC